MYWIIAFVALMVIILIGGLRVHRRDKQGEQSLESLGFHDADGNHDWLVSRLQGWYETNDGRLEVINVRVRPSAEYTLYVMDLRLVYKHWSDSLLGSRVVALVSDRLDLPRFQIMPRLEASGAMGWLVGKLETQWSDKTEITFPSHPDIAAAYQIQTKDEAAVRSFFTGERLEGLSLTARPEVKAWKDILLVPQVLIPGPKKGQLDYGGLEQRIDAAIELYQRWHCR